MARYQSPAARRYIKSLATLMIAYGFTLFGVSAFFTNHPGVQHPIAYVLGVLPAVPLILVFVAIGRFLQDEPDEYRRLLLTRQALVATGFMLSVATIWGFLENFGLVPHVYAYYGAVLWFGGLGLGSLVNALLEPRASEA